MALLKLLSLMKDISRFEKGEKRKLLATLECMLCKKPVQLAPTENNSWPFFKDVRSIVLNYAHLL